MTDTVARASDPAPHTEVVVFARSECREARPFRFWVAYSVAGWFVEGRRRSVLFVDATDEIHDHKEAAAVAKETARQISDGEWHNEAALPEGAW